MFNLEFEVRVLTKSGEYVLAVGKRRAGRLQRVGLGPSNGTDKVIGEEYDIRILRVT